MNRPRVLLAEDNPVMAAELRALLEPELEVVATGALGHVLKAAAATDLMPAVHAALRNERYVSSRLRGRPSQR